MDIMYKKTITSSHFPSSPSSPSISVVYGGYLSPTLFSVSSWSGESARIRNQDVWCIPIYYNYSLAGPFPNQTLMTLIPSGQKHREGQGVPEGLIIEILVQRFSLPHPSRPHPVSLPSPLKIYIWSFFKQL